MANLLDKDKKFLWHPFTPQESELPNNLLIERGEGIYLHTHDGRKIMDAISSWWVNLHGHAHPAIAKALAQQALQLEHVIFAGFTHAAAISLAEKLLSVLPAEYSKIFYSDNGSTANEVAIKMAVQYWHNQGIKKKKIIAFEGAYHGDTFGAMAVGDRSVFTAPFADYLFQVEFLDFPTPENESRVIQQFEKIIAANDIAAFIFEPLVQGASGMRMYSHELLDTLLAIAKKQDILCIADEVFTGFYRTGKFFATDYLHNKPDIIALSKGLTGGTLPLGVTACTEKIHTAFQTKDLTKAFLHGHSFTANPLSCAAANVSFDLLQQQSCLKQIEAIQTSHKEFVESLKGHPMVKDVRSFGTILAVEINTAAKSSYTDSLRDKILKHFIKHNILLRPLGNILYVVPPYVIKKDELNYIYNHIRIFLESLQQADV